MTQDLTMPAPFDHQAERALIGATLQTLPDHTLQLVTHTTPNQFHNPIHATIWTAITARTTLHEPVDPTLIAADLARTGHLNKLPGGAPYLYECTQLATPANAGYYARIIADHHVDRQLQTHTTRLHQTLATVTDPIRRHQLVAEIFAAGTQLLTHPGQTANGRHITLKAAAMFPIRPVRWTWDARMPLGELTLIPGREGAGKSIFFAWLAAQITRGTLPGHWYGQPKAVLYAASEDSWSYTIAPRLLVAGADLNMVYRIDTTNGDGTTTSLNLPRDTLALPQAAKDVDAAILMCDPILSLVDEGLNTFKAAELRQALTPLKEAAEQAELAIAALVHFNKGSHNDINSMISGARAWSEVARAVIAIAVDKDADDYTVIVSQTKNNLGTLQLPNMAYTIDDVVVETKEGDAHVGRLRWLGETDTSAEDLLTGDPGDRGLSDNTMKIIKFVEDSDDTEVSVADILNHFKGTINPMTVRKTLSRCVTRGDLTSQTRGTYSPGKGRKPHRKRAGS